jgi:TonB family protein
MLYLKNKSMYKSLLIIIVGLLPIASFAQVKSEEVVEVPAEKVFNFVETMPEFPGGQKEISRFVQMNVHYPDSAREEGIEGKVYISFIVDTVGNVIDANVIRRVHPLLDNEALRVVNSMPKWTPGTQRGKPVKVKFNLPINFKLD